jgi:hypothetical protein
MIVQFTPQKISKKIWVFMIIAAGEKIPGFRR